MRDARPVSSFGTSSSHTVSFFRRMKRSTFTPHVCLSADANRSWDSGIRISADQPRSSTETCDCQTASQAESCQVSL